MDEKRFRFDLLIAISALLISTVAAAASAYQTYVVNQQFSAAVWPYLNFDTTTDVTNNFFKISVQNVGLGPAIIRSTSVTLDGRTVPQGPSANALDTALDATVAETKRAYAGKHGVSMTLSTSGIGRGDVVPAGASIALLQSRGVVVPFVLKQRKHLDIAICYCSILDRCWLRRLSRPEPSGVRSCPFS